jgi:hypothetical protein
MPKMNDRPAASIAFWFASEIIPASATTVTSGSRRVAAVLQHRGAVGPARGLGRASRGGRATADAEGRRNHCGGGAGTAAAVIGTVAIVWHARKRNKT